MKKAASALLLLPIIFFASCMKKPVSEIEKSVFVSTNDFLELGAEFPDNFRDLETFTKTVYLDTGIELQYEYESDEGYPSYLYSTCTFEHRLADLLAQRLTFEKTFELSLKANSTSMEEIENFPKIGNYSKAWLIINEANQPIGNLFINSNNHFLLITAMSGLYIDDPSIYAELIEEKYNNAMKFKHGLYKLEYSSP